MPDGRQVMIEAVAAAVKPRLRLTVSQWADANRILSSKGASEPGRWRTSRTPYLREIMDCLSLHSPVREIDVMKAAQLGFTTAIGVNWIGYTVDHDPGSMIVALPTDKLMEEWIEQDLMPMVTDTACVRDKMSAKTRDAANRKDLKSFPGGMLMLMGANSPNNFRQKKAKKQFRDDIDGWPHSVGKEGDPVDLLDNRSATFMRKKIVNVSTPTIKGASRIEEKFERGDQRRYHVPCPHCGELQSLKWPNLQYRHENGIVREAWYVCEHCGCEIEEHHKTRMLEAGRWIAANEHAPKGVRSYQINALYAPIGLGDSWQDLAQQWINAQDDVTKLKVFINTKLGEPWEDKDRKIDENAIRDRAKDENFGLRCPPPGCLIITAGIDTQDDRLAVQLVGHGRHETKWPLDYVEFPGIPDMLIDEFLECRGALFEYLSTPLVNAWGKEMRIRAIAWDTGGHYTHEVYAACRSKVLPRLMAIKGANTPNAPILAGRPSWQDVNRRGKVLKGRHGVALWLVGASRGKDLVHNMLRSDAKRTPENRRLRFSPELPDEYYPMLLAEVFDPEKNRWIKKRGRRNEGLDTLIYAIAAGHHPEIRVHTMRERDWDVLQRQLEPPDIEPGDAPDPEAEASQDQPQPRRRRGRRARGGGFVKKF